MQIELTVYIPVLSDNPIPAPSKRQYTSHAPVALLICIGLILRVYKLWEPPLWVDEYRTWWVVAGNTWAEIIEGALKIHVQTPLYYLMVGGITQIAGYDTFQLHLLSIVVGTATLGLVDPIALKLFDNRRVALLALTIFSLSEPLIWYSQIDRPYALALFFSFVSFWSFVSLQKIETNYLRIVYIISTALTGYAHYVFGSIVIIQAIYLLVCGPYHRKVSLQWVVSFLATGLLLVPALHNFLYLHSQRHELDWVSSLDSSWKIASGIVYLFGGRTPIACLTTIITAATLGFKWLKWTRTEIRTS